MLRSLKEIFNYVLSAEDVETGRCKDFLFDDELRTIRYLVVHTRNWLPGRDVLTAPSWIESVSWAEKSVTVPLTTKEVKESPEYQPAHPVTRQYEVRLYDFYGRPAYWK